MLPKRQIDPYLVSANPAARRGAMLVLVTITLIILMLAAVFSIDVAYMHLARAELRTATDAAARAGCETLTRTQDTERAMEAAISTANRNFVAGQALTLLPEQVEFGSIRQRVDGGYDFFADESPFTAVRVSASRSNDSADGNVKLFFGRAFQLASFEPRETATAGSNVRDVALVLDVSGSMRRDSGGMTRLEALQDAVHLFMSELDRGSGQIQVSLTSYSSRAKKEMDLTTDYSRVLAKVDRFRANGLTAIGEALVVGSDTLVDPRLARPHAAKTIILMTDGNHNRGPSPLETVSTAVDRGQQVYAITFSDEANIQLMREVAEATTGGVHLHANSADDLSGVFRTIARSLSVMLVD